MAAPKKAGKSRVSRVATKAKARTDGGPSKTSLKGDVAKGAGPTPAGGKASRPAMKAPAVTKAGAGTIAQRANAVAARRAATGK
jgi:hypothetical protein